ncbi:hypothetical protein F511_31682 [Dorcoceras hygrometricum]|uniref:Uncharacterized protein n=1 Tax=Dorcoceras hygrometricum TaxID=472368 RepID=A0A2Z7D060_9LAMI|nr:hypothetical protein F511_31682 [Dorcoceras hygrometricum]
MADPDPVSRGVSPCWRLGAWLQPDSQGILAFHGLTNLARTESPQLDDLNKSDHGGGGTAVEATAVKFWKERGQPLASWYHSGGSSAVLACCVKIRSRTTSLIVVKGSGEPDFAVEVVSGASRRWAGASTCSGSFSMDSPRFEVRLVRLGPSGLGVCPVGRAPAMVVGARRANAKTRKCHDGTTWLERPFAATSSPWLAHGLSQGRSCYDRLHLGVVQSEGLRQWWPEQGDRS